MPEFYVTWEIEVDADDHEDAARKAKSMRQAYDTTADVYNVRLNKPRARKREIDLSAVDGHPVN